MTGTDKLSFNEVVEQLKFHELSAYIKTMLAFLKKMLRTMAWRFQLLKKNFHNVLILHLLKPLISVLHVFQALSTFCFS